ncbi:MAG TPA: TonB-dependent receptor [Longimicrobiales bacterium]
MTNPSLAASHAAAPGAPSRCARRRIPRRALCALCTLAVLLSARGAASAQQAGAVTGVIRDAETGEPLADARVGLEELSRFTFTDTRGRYRIGSVPPGEWTLVVELLGRTPVRRTVHVPAAGAAVADVRLAVNALGLAEFVISVSREAQRLSETAASVGIVSGEELRETRPAHPSEVLGRVPGVWISQTGGEGHMAAIRQPLTTNPVYLYLEDGIPTRSTGFFNHNALYEVNLPQADRVEVLKGPATALYGSDAIGGVINVSTRAPSETAQVSFSLEGGSHGWARLLGSLSDTWGQDGLRLDVNLSRTDGWRDGTGYDRQSATLRWDRPAGRNGKLRVVASASRIDQQTAGSSVIAREDYERNPTANYTPISFREVGALRLSAAYERLGERSLLAITPYFRWNTMDVLPNWTLTFDPAIWETENASYGLLARYRRDFEPLRARVVAGVDVDLSPGRHFERAITPVRTGRVFESYTAGDPIYDYDVTFRGISPYLHVEAAPTDRLHLTAGVRYDDLGYRYRNDLSVVTTGNHRRPADADVSYRRISPKLGATYAFGEGFGLFAAWQHGFRAPSEGQVFRQGRAENTLGLEPVKVQNVEAGVRGRIGGRFGYELAVYRMTKTDDILSLTNPDGSTETVNAGETLHQGIEAGFGAALHPALRVDVAYSYARHTYERWRPRAGVDFSGNEMESAPREIANVRISWSPALLRGGGAALEWARIGEYWMDAENTHRYPGHDLLHLRAEVPVAEHFTLFGRVTNLLDERYAETATYTVARGEEFAPGLARTFYAGIEYR